MFKKRFVFLLLTTILCASMPAAQGGGDNGVDSNTSTETGTGDQVIYETGTMFVQNDSREPGFLLFIIWSFAVFFVGMIFMWVVLFVILGFRKPVVRQSQKAGYDYAPAKERTEKKNVESQEMIEYMRKTDRLFNGQQNLEHQIDRLFNGQQNLEQQIEKLKEQNVYLKTRLPQSALVETRQTKIESPEPSVRISTGAALSQPLSQYLSSEQKPKTDAGIPINQNSRYLSGVNLQTQKPQTAVNARNTWCGDPYVNQPPSTPPAPKLLKPEDILNVFNTWASGSPRINQLPSIFSYANHDGRLQTSQMGDVDTINPEAEWVISKEPDTDGRKYLFPNPAALNPGSRLELYTRSGAYNAKGENRIKVDSPCIMGDKGFILEKGSFTVV